MNKSILFTIFLLFLSGCGKNYDGSYDLPLLYKIDIQQGNIIEQRMINQLRSGMSKEQVRFIIGTPVLIDSFHPNRWDYVYISQTGGQERSKRHITLHFKEEKLAYITGDIKKAP